MSCRYDFAQASLHVDEKEALEFVQTAFQGELRPSDSRFRNYKRTLELPLGEDRTDGTVFLALEGSSNNPYPSVKLSGERSDELVIALRSELGDGFHFSRVDACIDFLSPKGGTYEKLKEYLKTVSEMPRYRRVRHYEWDNKRGLGSTTYLGNNEQFLLRAYEKGKELRAREKSYHWRQKIPLDLTRLEAQCRPKGKLQREKAKTATAEQIFGFAGYGREFFKLATGLTVASVPQSMRIPKDFDTRFHNACVQAGPLLEELLERCGSEEAFCRALFDRIEEIKRDRQRMH